MVNHRPELFFYESCEVCAQFFLFCICKFSCSGIICRKHYFVPLCYLCFFVKDHLIFLCGSISGLSALSHWPFCLLFLQNNTLVMTTASQPFLKLSGIGLPTVFFFSILLGLLGLLLLHKNFRIIFLILTKMVGIFL